jgi:hypothetical protein
LVGSRVQCELDAVQSECGTHHISTPLITHLQGCLHIQCMLRVLGWLCCYGFFNLSPGHSLHV